MSQLILQFPSVVRHSDQTELIAPVGDGRELKIAIHGASDLLDRLTPSIIPFLPISLLLAGQERRSLYIDADVDDAWWLNLVDGFWPLLKRLLEFDDLTITRKGTGFLAPPLTDEIALMFSAGVDSFYSLKRMRDIGVHPDWFVNINAGADRDCMAQRVANVREVAREVGVGLITIDTNFHEVFNVFQIRSHTVRLLAPAYCLFPGVARFAYSSTGAFEDISYALAKKHNDIGYLDHAVCSTLTPAAISISITGSEADRINKTAAIGEDPIATRFLDVCIDEKYQAVRTAAEPINCGRCYKCIRTMLTLDHFKLLRNFKSQFPIEEYFDKRDELILVLAKRTHPLDVAARALAAQPGELRPGVRAAHIDNPDRLDARFRWLDPE
jgi:hypothetical protein